MIPKWRTIHPRGQAIVCTPNVNPFEGLFIGLVAAGIDPEKAAFVKTPSPTVFRDLAERLGASRRSGIPKNSASSPHDGILGNSATEPWLLFIDQFEELFTRIPEKERKPRETFIAALVDAASIPSSPLQNSNTPPLQSGTTPSLRVVLAMRDDFFGNLRDHEALFRITDKNLERVIAMKGPELREIIEEPAFSHGVRFQEGLVKTITESVEGRAGMLPLLQYTLEALWNQERSLSSPQPSTNTPQPTQAHGLSDGVLSRRAYDAIGGVEGALQKRITHFYNTKTVDQRRAVRNILLSLVEVNESSGDATTVSRAAPREALAQAGSEEILKELLNEEKLLISIGGEEDEPLVELAHEALIKGWEEFESYIRALEAENWTAATRFYEALTDEQKRTPYSAVITALRPLADQVISASYAGLPKLAQIRTSSALVFVADLDPAHADAFSSLIGQGFSEEKMGFAMAEPVFSTLPKGAPAAVVAGSMSRNLLHEARDLQSVMEGVANAVKSGAPDAVSVFARCDLVGLVSFIDFALDSGHAEALPLALAASEAVLQVNPGWDGSYHLRGKALVKAGKAVEAIPLFEKGLALDQINKAFITTALEEARAAAKAMEAASQPATAPK